MKRYGVFALFGLLIVAGMVLIYTGNIALGLILTFASGIGIAFTILYLRGKNKGVSMSMEQHVGELETRRAQLPAKGPYAQVTYNPEAPDGIEDMSMGYTDPSDTPMEFRPGQILQESAHDFVLAHKNNLLNGTLDRILQNIIDPTARQEAILNATRYLGDQTKQQEQEQQAETSRSRRQRRTRRTRGTKTDPFDVSGGTFFKRKKRS